MTNYYLKKLNNEQYYLVCKGCDSVVSYLDEIENEFLIQSNEGSLIIDQLLVSGNGKNRFIDCRFSYGKVQLNTAKNIESTDKYKRISSELFNQNLEILKYSILTDNQLKQLQHGQYI
jgi:hypothetical protein